MGSTLSLSPYNNFKLDHKAGEFDPTQTNNRGLDKGKVENKNDDILEQDEENHNPYQYFTIGNAYQEEVARKMRKESKNVKRC